MLSNETTTDDVAGRDSTEIGVLGVLRIQLVSDFTEIKPNQPQNGNLGPLIPLNTNLLSHGCTRYTPDPLIFSSQNRSELYSSALQHLTGLNHIVNRAVYLLDGSGFL